MHVQKCGPDGVVLFTRLAIPALHSPVVGAERLMTPFAVPQDWARLFVEITAPSINASAPNVPREI
jgi:hypothetical protein